MNASLSLDLDNLWSYLKTHGDAAWQEHPSYLETGVPHILRLARELDVTLTIFVVGRDAAFEHNHDLLRRLAEDGHEIGNHSFHHEPWIDTRPRERVAEELEAAHAAIATATGTEPIGYRGPGFSISPPILETLASMRYRYDASRLPTWIGPIARWYYFRSTDLSPTEVEQRQGLFGSFRDWLTPNTPYEWKLTAGSLAEVPVTTMPGVRIPIHVSYLLYLSGFSPRLAETYFRGALWACRARGTGPSILLHPLDLLGGDEVADLAFFPGMDLAGSVKRARTARYVEMLAGSFTVTTVIDQLESIPTLGTRTL
jgi:peptidoglycan/xylan/chitin deacetylase (PgdA/CDA1 family)